MILPLLLVQTWLISMSWSLTIESPRDSSQSNRPNFSFVFVADSLDTVECCLTLLEGPSAAAQSSLGCTNKIVDGRGGMLVTKAASGFYRFRIDAKSETGEVIENSSVSVEVRRINFVNG